MLIAPLPKRARIATLALALLLSSAVAVRGQDLTLIGRLLEQGRFVEALEALESASAESAAGRHLAARAWEGLGDLPKAAAAAEAAVALQPKNELFRLELGRLFLTGANPTAALGVFEQGLALAPENVYLLLGAGVALNQLRRYEEAEPRLEAALARAPSLGLALDALIEAYFRQTKLDEAAEAAQAYRAESPEDYRGPYHLAVVEERRGAPPERVEELLREALDRRGTYAPAHALLGKTLLELGREQEAILSLEGAVRLDPSDPLAHMHLARAYRAVGRVDDARREAETVRELGQQKEAPPVLRRREEPR